MPRLDPPRKCCLLDSSFQVMCQWQEMWDESGQSGSLYDGEFDLYTKQYVSRYLIQYFYRMKILF